MKKKFLALSVLALIVSIGAAAKIAVPRFRIVFDLEKEFDINVFVIPGWLDKIPDEEIPAQDQVTTHYGIKITDPETKMEGEVRYTLYKDTVGGDSSKNEVISDMNSIFLAHFLNAFGIMLSPQKFMELNPEMVKEKTKGDFGGRTYLHNGASNDLPSEYGKGWKYAQIEYFYKAGQGLVIRTFLFNDKKFAGLNEDFTQADDYVKSPLSHVYWSFLFKE